MCSERYLKYELTKLNKNMTKRFLKMKNIKSIISISLAILLTACAHHDNVRPSDNGEHYVVLTAVTKSEVSKEAIKQSNHYCDEQDKKAYVLNENIEYKGSLSEEEYLTKHNIANAVKTAGTALWMFGEEKANDAGAAIAIGGGAFENSLGQPYELKMSFTCR
jgi:hypothetical protein